MSRVRQESRTSARWSGRCRVASTSRISGVAARSMAATTRVIDVEDDFGANGEIEEGRRITGEELSCAGDFGTREEDELNAVTVARETAVIVDDPNDAEIFDDGDDFRGILRSE